MNAALRHVAVVGGGVAAALAGLALARRIPDLSVTWIDTGIPAGAIEDLPSAAPPSFGHLHRTLGIDDAEILRLTRCGRRTGTLVEHWATDRFFRGHDWFPAGLSGIPFHLLWLRLSHDTRDAPAWIDIAGGAMTDDGTQRAAPALLLDLADYRDILGALAKHAGIRRIEAPSVDIASTADRQRIDAVRLCDGQLIAADLFIDATGPTRSVRGTLPCQWIDWSGQLSTRTLRVEHRPPVAKPPLNDRLIAEPDGWRIEACLPRESIVVTGRGDEAAGEEHVETIALFSGHLDAPFHGNVVALGSAAAVMEPIGATALHLLCRQIEHLIAAWPDRDLDPVEIRLYNRRAALDADRMRDFVQAHFVASRHGTPFWQQPCSPLSERLFDDLALFGARGRLVPADEDSFEADEWIATLLGLGFWPTQRDTLAQAMPLAQARQHVAASLSRKGNVP